MIDCRKLCYPMLQQKHSIPLTNISILLLHTFEELILEHPYCLTFTNPTMHTVPLLT